MTVDAQVAFMDIVARNRPQVFVAGVLVQPVADLRPADLVIEFAYLLFGVRHSSIFWISGVSTTAPVAPYYRLTGQVTKSLPVFGQAQFGKHPAQRPDGHILPEVHQPPGKRQGYSKKNR